MEGGKDPIVVASLTGWWRPLMDRDWLAFAGTVIGGFSIKQAWENLLPNSPSIRPFWLRGHDRRSHDSDRDYEDHGQQSGHFRYLLMTSISSSPAAAALASFWELDCKRCSRTMSLQDFCHQRVHGAATRG